MPTEHTALPDSQGLWKKGASGLSLLSVFCEITAKNEYAKSNGHEQP